MSFTLQGNKVSEDDIDIVRTATLEALSSVSNLEIDDIQALGFQPDCKLVHILCA